jgi:hypothetical protein
VRYGVAPPPAGQRRDTSMLPSRLCTVSSVTPSARCVSEKAKVSLITSRRRGAAGTARTGRFERPAVHADQQLQAAHVGALCGKDLRTQGRAHVSAPRAIKTRRRHVPPRGRGCAAAPAWPPWRRRQRRAVQSGGATVRRGAHGLAGGRKPWASPTVARLFGLAQGAPVSKCKRRPARKRRTHQWQRAFGSIGTVRTRHCSPAEGRHGSANQRENACIQPRARVPTIAEDSRRELTVISCSNLSAVLLRPWPDLAGALAGAAAAAAACCCGAAAGAGMGVAGGAGGRTTDCRSAVTVAHVESDREQGVTEAGDVNVSTFRPCSRVQRRDEGSTR